MWRKVLLLSLFVVSVVSSAEYSSEQLKGDLDKEVTNVKDPRNRMYDEVISNESNDIGIDQMNPEVPPLRENGNVEDIIQSYEPRSKVLAQSAEDFYNHEDIDQIYEPLVEPIEVLIEMLQQPNNVYEFLEAKGIERVLLPSLQISNENLRRGLLTILNTLFKTAPTTTKMMIPITALDKILDIFEEEEIVEFKSLVLEILYAWLPENPRAQARVMKVKGLDPFYEQIHKIDRNSLYVLLKLFSKVLQEHINSRKDFSHKSREEILEANTYRKIGLIERLQTRRGCMGVLNIFQAMGTPNKLDDNIMPILEIIKNIKPYCIEHFRGIPRAKEFFENIANLAKEYHETEHLTQISDLVQEYLDKINELSKDEL